MTSAEDYPDHVDDAEQLLRAVLTRHHIARIPLPAGTLRLRISRDFFLPFRSDEIGLSAFRELAGKDTIRRHADSMFSYCGFGRTQCADMREIDAEVEAAPHSKGSGAREHRSQRAADRRGYSLISGGLRGHASWKDPSGQSSCMPQGLCRAGSVEGTIHRGMGSGIQRLSQGHPSAPMIPHAAGMDGIQRTPPFCGSWLPWLACTEGERRRSGFPFRSPDIGGLSGGWHATAGGIAGRGIGCVHADRSPLPEGVPAVGPMMGKERG